MSAIIIEVGGNRVRLREAPYATTDQPDPASFPAKRVAQYLLRRDAVAPGYVRACGRRLCSRITKSEAVRLAIAYLKTNPDALTPIYLEADSLEHLPWEAMWSKGLEFLALGATASVARIPSYRRSDQLTVRMAEPTLKILAVIAAEDDDIDEFAEWKALRRALDSCGGGVELRLLVSNVRLQREVALLNDARIQCEFVPPSEESLIRIVQTFGPNVIHFMCHGVAAPSPRLLLPTNVDGERCDLSVATLKQMTRHDTVWMMVMNACHGASAHDGASSLAKDVVTTGIPAVVAMRDSIHWTDANTFSEAFYGTLLPPLLRHLAGLSQGKQPFPVKEVLTALRAARQGLKDAFRGTPATKSSADDSLEWTLPVLYVRPESFIQPRPPEREDPRLKAALAVLRDCRTKLARHGARRPLEELDAEIAALEREIQRDPQRVTG